MREYVFIAWSDSNDLPICIKKKLDANGFCGVIGGDYEGNPNLFHPTETVGQTIRNQMKYCDQAIVLFRNPVGKNGTKNKYQIGGNIVYEVGYLTSKFGEKFNEKMHIFNIDIKKTDRHIFPTDLDGQWGTNVISKEKTNEEISDEIVSTFLRHQVNDREESIFQLINQYRYIEYEMDVHISNPLCSDFELANKIIFYIQAAYIYQEIKMASQKCLNLKLKLQRQQADMSYLKQVLEYADITFKMFSYAIPSKDDGLVHLSKEKFQKTLYEYTVLMSSVMKEGNYDRNFKLNEVLFDEKTVNDEVKFWMVVQAQQHIEFLHLLYLDNPDLNEEDKNKIAYNGLLFGNAAIKNMASIRRSYVNKEFSQLLLGYIYRTASCFYRILGEGEKQKEYQRMSLENRKALYIETKTNNLLNPELKDYIALEYFSELADNFESVDDIQSVEFEIKELGDFLEEKTSYSELKGLVLNRLKNAYEKIKQNIGI